MILFCYQNLFNGSIMCQNYFLNFSATRGRYFGIFSHFFALFLLFSDLIADFITRMVCTQLKLYFPI